MLLDDYIELLSAIVKKPFNLPVQLIAKDLAITARATYIRNQYKQNKVFPNSALVSFCVDLEEKSSTECCGIDLGCKVLVTPEIPLPIDVKEDILFNFVGGIDGMKAYGYLKPDEIPFIKYRKFTSKLPYYTWLNKRIVVLNKPASLKLKVRYVPSDPTKLSTVTDCITGGNCWDESSLFIEDHWEDAITKMVIPKLTQILEKEIKVDENRESIQPE
jgi:hypothetical protein